MHFEQTTKHTAIYEFCEAQTRFVDEVLHTYFVFVGGVF